MPWRRGRRIKWMLLRNKLPYENCTLLGYYAVSSGNLLPMFRDNLLVPSSGVKNPKESLLSQCGVYTGKSVGSEKTQ
jgi:hypothetical protein